MSGGDAPPQCRNQFVGSTAHGDEQDALATLQLHPRDEQRRDERGVDPGLRYGALWSDRHGSSDRQEYQSIHVREIQTAEFAEDRGGYLDPWHRSACLATSAVQGGQ